MVWRRLQSSDHFYYMCTKWFSDGDVHKYFNPYGSPYDAYINFMNVLGDFTLTLEQGAPFAPASSADGKAAARPRAGAARKTKAAPDQAAPAAPAKKTASARAKTAKTPAPKAGTAKAAGTAKTRQAAGGKAKAVNDAPAADDAGKKTRGKTGTGKKAR
jgi:hypothetical protein